MNDVEAIRQLKQGKIGGLEHFVLRYQVRATRAVFLVTHDQALAEDVVQETFIHIFKNAHRIDETRPIEPYLMRSMVNAALNACRNDQRFIPAGGAVNDIESLIAQAASLESQLEYAEARSEILQALKQLSPRERAAVMQRYYLEMSEKEMALALDTAPGTVKWLLNTARNKLRGLLGHGRQDEH